MERKKFFFAQLHSICAESCTNIEFSFMPFYLGFYRPKTTIYNSDILLKDHVFGYSEQTGLHLISGALWDNFVKSIYDRTVIVNKCFDHSAYLSFNSPQNPGKICDHYLFDQFDYICLVQRLYFPEHQRVFLWKK